MVTNISNTGNISKMSRMIRTLAIAGVVVATIGLWLKARLEEQFLFEELGPAIYGTYKTRTPMLVPRTPRRPGAA